MRRLAGALLGVACLSCSPAPAGRTFVLITIDTLQADRLGVHGCPRGTSPAIDRLARRGALFTDCVSVSSWTMPAMGTIATGLKPNEHGMVYWHMPLADVEETVAEALGRRGVRTAFLGNPIPALEGLDRGFEEWRTFEGDDGAAVDAAVEWLARTPDDRFLWVHLLTPHSPYDPEPATVRADPELDPRTVAYDAEIRTVDLLVRRLLAAIGPDAAVGLTSDHGETLDGRPELQYEHGAYLFEELIRVPCVVRVPGARPALVRAAVTVADLPPTVCDWFGTDAPSGAFGTSLLPAVRGVPLRDRGPTFAQVLEDDPPERIASRWSVRDGARKAVFDVKSGTSQLFDLASDPGERIDVGPERDAELDSLWAMLRAWRQAAPDPRIPFDQLFSPEELERIRSLGYLGGADAD